MCEDASPGRRVATLRPANRQGNGRHRGRRGRATLRTRVVCVRPRAAAAKRTCVSVTRNQPISFVAKRPVRHFKPVHAARQPPVCPSDPASGPSYSGTLPQPQLRRAQHVRALYQSTACTCRVIRVKRRQRHFRRRQCWRSWNSSQSPRRAAWSAWWMTLRRPAARASTPTSLLPSCAWAAAMPPCRTPRAECVEPVLHGAVEVVAARGRGGSSQGQSPACPL